ncbi:oxygen-dependent tRNA uridine(34) hydroxylase TrhO [Frigidibacter oleivorans]|uniref:oxygen-dependent tRNA uridine(34) hydroxylase TrhO n=1 Tax=Frigidibacter oleivorans TaxID=2487129 RepID=UPI000F8EBBE8|nr:rhodanese-related sulfurtransferase [Frigidibacter oleivorans]
MFAIAALYRFAPLPDPAALRGPLLDLCRAEGVRGTLLLAPEGINGTIAGTAGALATVIAHLETFPGCAALEVKRSEAETMPFGRMKVRLKREIVTMGQPQVDPLAGTGRYVEPQAWNALIRANDVVVIDTRNDYEVAIGSFAGAVDPGTRSFRDFPDWWRAHRDDFAGKRIAMFCTGGIRCEKSTNFLLGEGVDEVFHLRGGILNYLEQVPREDSLWRGECFVFDQRVSVGHGLVPGGLSSCHACRRPLDAADRAHPDYEQGVSCPRCRADQTEADRARFRERERQMRIAAARGQRHLGAEFG